MIYADARPLSRDPDSSPLLFGLVAAIATLFALMLLLLNVTIVLYAVVGITTMAFVIVRPRWALYLLLACAMLSEVHLSNPNRATGVLLFSTLGNFGINLTPTELIMLFATIGLAIRLLFDDEVHFRPGTLAIPISLFMFAALVGIGVGLARGADMTIMRAETRGLFYLPVVYLLITHFITTRKHVETLMWLFVITANLMALENVYRYLFYVRGGYQLDGSPNLAFSHESALFIAAAIVLLFARFAWSNNIAREWKSLALLVIPIIALLVMKRRAGVVALDVGLVVLCLVLLRQNFRMFVMIVPVAAVFIGLLLSVTWNAPGGTGTFARSFRSATGDQTVSERDASSDDYRKQEGTNIRLNIQADPFVGIGFGREYKFYVPVADLSFWELWRFVPHNSVMWFWMKAGIIGFVAMATLFAVAIARSMQILRSLGKDTLAPYAFSMAAFVVMFVVYSWVDLGLVTPRTMVWFAIVLGTIATLGYLAPSDGDAASASGAAPAVKGGTA